MNFDVESISHNICRSCLNNDPVFEISPEVFEKLKLCGGIEMEETDSKTLPSKICHKCFINLEISYEFRKICQQSDKKLREIMRNSLLEFKKHDDILEKLKVEFLAPKEEPDEILNQEYTLSNSQIGYNLNLDDTDTEELIKSIQLEEERKESKFDVGNFILSSDNHNQEKLQSNSRKKETKIKIKGKYKKKLNHDRIQKEKTSSDNFHTCEFCGINYVSKFSMENHMRLHSARLRFVCEICGDSYAGKFQLEQHMCSKHTGERNFKCEYCDKAFFSKTLRNKHQKRSHSKLFKCDQCDKCFGRSDSLKKHKRVHTGEKPIVCDKCGTRFKELHHLKNHNKSMTPCILKMSIKVKDA